MEHQSKTQIYLKVKKPLLERHRRARINNCLEALKKLVAELQADEAVLRMDKTELLEQTLVFVRQQCRGKAPQSAQVYTVSFRNGYMNAVNKVSRVMASIPGMSVEVGKSVMTHLGCRFHRLQQQQQQQSQHITVQEQQQVSHRQTKIITNMQPLSIECAPLSPASSGYHSDCESPTTSTAAQQHKAACSLWRPW